MDTIEALRKYNRWRRGEAWHEAAGPNPQDIGEQIDAAADELERLQAELAEQCRLNGAGSEREARLLAQVEEQRREIERLRKDAERYRWLRYQIERLRLVIAESCGWGGLKSWSGDTPDERIDAAMAKGE